MGNPTVTEREAEEHFLAALEDEGEEDEFEPTIEESIFASGLHRQGYM